MLSNRCKHMISWTIKISDIYGPLWFIPWSSRIVLPQRRCLKMTYSLHSWFFLMPYSIIWPSTLHIIVLAFSWCLYTWNCLWKLLSTNDYYKYIHYNNYYKHINRSSEQVRILLLQLKVWLWPFSFFWYRGVLQGELNFLLRKWQKFF